MFDTAIDAIAEATPQVAVVVPTVTGLTLHVDGDYLAYFCGAVDISKGEARQNAINRIASVQARIGADGVVIHFTDSGSQKGERPLIATVKPYQGQRSGDKPFNTEYLADWMQTYEGPLFRSKTWLHREADDGIGACAHFACGKQPGAAGIYTRDKDMRMLPGLHINWQNIKIVTKVLPGDYDVRGEDGKQYGLKFFFQQMLMGDTADNCPGLERYMDDKGIFKRCGEKTAEALLAHSTSTEEACRTVLDHYLAAYTKGPDIALDRFCEQASLMWMRLGNDAGVADFAHHNGFSRINHCFDQPIWDAVERLETRVKLAREQISSFSNQNDPLTADCNAGG